MGIPLTPQEKKVLGFVLFLLVFGLAVLGVKHLLGDPNAGGFPPTGTPENAGQVIAADFIAVCSGVWNHPQGPAAAVKAYLSAIERAVKA